VSAIYIPFFIWSHTGIAAVFKGLLTYSKEWAIDAAVFQCLYSFLGLFFSHSNFNFFLLTKFFLGFCYLIILIIIVRKNENSDIGLLNKIFWSLAWLFLLSPVGNPWYFCWLIPFLCFFPYRSFILLSGLLIFNYLSFTHNIGGLSLGNFSISYVTLLQYIVFFPLLIRETILRPLKEAEVNVLRT
ncbi:MAG: hypothetical protein NG737_05370, partial [Omnitrophica bacterium]|nr:hypothetical protein [Candidatus Omnitrophota bacterium]